MTAGIDEEPNVSVRDRSERAAARGADELVAETAGAIGRLVGVLDAPRSPDVVHLPWQGWALTTDDYLITRSMEIVDHCDDLASSVGLEPPEFPDDLVDDVLALLSAIAVRRHGQAALIRTLSRPQRAPDTVAAF